MNKETNEPRRELSSRIKQIAVMQFTAGPNNGDYCTLVALCDDGSVWEQYHSNGFSNMPTDMLWHPLHPSHE